MSVIILILVIVGVCALAYYYLTMPKKPKDSWLADYKYAHRGLHTKEFPENTMPAIIRAKEQGFAIEIDIHLSKDDELIVFHDKTLDRVTNKSGDVSSYTAAELNKICVENTEYTIPLLKEVLREIKGEVPLLIEIKNEGGAGKVETLLYNMLKDYDGLFAVQSFSPFSMRWFYKNAPDVLRGQLSCSFKMGAEHIDPIKLFCVKTLLTNFLCRPNFISYGKEVISAYTVVRLRKMGLPVLCWTIISTEEEHYVKKYADTIIFEGYNNKIEG